MAELSPAGSPAQRVRVAVVFGGASSEHAVSCLTAAGVVGALDPERFDVVGVGITRSGRWVVVDRSAVARLQVHQGRLPELGEDAAEAVLMHGSELAVREPSDPQRSAPHRSAPHPSALASMGRVDVAISLLHGPYGEDGTIQGLFEMMGTRYVGAGVLASAVGMDKHFMKLVLAASGLPVGPFATITPAAWARDRAGSLAAVRRLRYPLYVKPARGGSSLGISRVEDPEKLPAAVELAQQYDPKVVVEQGFVGARELECGVLADLAGGRPRASAVAEIRVHSASGFYDFEAKYLPEEQVDLDVPAQVPAELAAQVQDLAVRTFEAVDCEGLARVDVFVTPDHEVVVNEINTMPGFTPHSMFPRMWAASGLSYPELVERLIVLALQRPVGLR